MSSVFLYAPPAISHHTRRTESLAHLTWPIAADLVDEFRVWIHPLVLGQGKRLFENGVPPRGLALVESRRTPTGVLLNTYRPAGPLPPPPRESETPSAAEVARRTKLAAEKASGPRFL